MKRWQHQQAVEHPVQVMQAPEPELKPVTPWFKCLSCLEASDILFEGSSYCQRCLKEKLRIGR